MTETELKTWLKAAQSGDTDAFTRIYDQFAPAIYRFIFFRVGHKEVAEDILSETFIKAWQKINQINSALTLSGWLYQIARNNVIDYYRVRKETVALDEVIDVLEDAASPVDLLNLSFQQSKILKAMESLPTEQRQVIQYRFFEDLSNEEIAHLLGKTEGAIRVIQHRAITKLKEILK